MTSTTAETFAIPSELIEDARKVAYWHLQDMTHLFLSTRPGDGRYRGSSVPNGNEMELLERALLLVDAVDASSEFAPPLDSDLLEALKAGAAEAVSWAEDVEQDALRLPDAVGQAQREWHRDRLPIAERVLDGLEALR